MNKVVKHTLSRSQFRNAFKKVLAKYFESDFYLKDLEVLNQRKRNKFIKMNESFKD